MSVVDRLARRLKIPRVSPVTDADHHANMAAIERWANSLPMGEPPRAHPVGALVTGDNSPVVLATFPAYENVTEIAWLAVTIFPTDPTATTTSSEFVFDPAPDGATTRSAGVPLIPIGAGASVANLILVGHWPTTQTVSIRVQIEATDPTQTFDVSGVIVTQPSSDQPYAAK